MKIVLPLAGQGTRLLPHTETMPKPLLFIAGKSIIDHLMSELISLNPSEFVFITGYLKEQLETHLRENFPNIPMKFIEQTDPQGLGHAIYQARDAFNKDEDMLVILGDQTFTIDWAKMLNNDYNRLSIIKVKNPSSFGIVNIDAQGFVTNMEEKPMHPKSNLAISGTYYFPSAQAVFAALAYQISHDIRTKGEIQMTDAMQIMLQQGEKFQTLEINDWNDCGNHKDLLHANRTLLKKYTQNPDFDDSVRIHPPIWVADQVEITNSVLGPNVTIAKGAKIHDSTISNSVINKNVSLNHCDLQDSYIGQDCQLENLFAKDQYLI